MGNKLSDRDQCNVVKVEFLTKKQKEKKDAAIREWEKNESAVEDEDGFSIVKNYEELYEADCRSEIYVPRSLKSVDIGYILNFLGSIDESASEELFSDGDECAYPQLAKFVKTTVKSFVLLLDGEPVNDRAREVDMAQCCLSNPVFEFIYEKYPLMEILARKAVYFVKNFKRTLLRSIVNFLGIAPILRTIDAVRKGDKTGIASVLLSKTVLQKLGQSVLGENILLGSAQAVLRLFFPFAAPVVSLCVKGMI